MQVGAIPSAVDEERHSESLSPATDYRSAEIRMRDLYAMLQQLVAGQIDELRTADGEFESFIRALSSNLEWPLNEIAKCGSALLDDCEKKRLDVASIGYVKNIVVACEQMTTLTEKLRVLSAVASDRIAREPVDVSEIARSVAEGLAERFSARKVKMLISKTPPAEADSRLVRILLENLLENAWKFTGKQRLASIAFGAIDGPCGEAIYYVRDNGVGFQKDCAKDLFRAFEKLHQLGEFDGSGIGLAIAKRIIDRHEGRVWTDGAVGAGATLLFTLQPIRQRGRTPLEPA